MFELIGFATLNGGTTGGTGGAIIDVSTDSQLADALEANDTPAIVIIHGQIDVTGSINVKSNKTVKSLGDGHIRYGRLNVDNASNVIITNLRMSEATDDSINIQYSNNVWIHRNTLENGFDGLCDIKHGSNYVTVSWNHFKNHDKTMLIGHDDANGSVDIGKLKTTIHHNWMENCNQRTPMVRFAEVHSFNNYISDTVNGVRVGVGARIYQEKCYYDRALRPYSYNATEDGWIKDVGSKFVDTITTEEDRKTDRPSGVTWLPSSYYAYTSQDPDDVKVDVMANAGVYVEEEEPEQPLPNKHPITLPEQQYICPSDAVNGDNIGRVHYLWSFIKFWNHYFGTSFTDTSFSFSKWSGSNAFAVNSSTGELTVSNISLFTADTTITIRVSVGGMYMDTVCTIIRATNCVYFDSTYDGSAGTSNGTRSRPYLKFNGSGLTPTAGKTYLWRRNRTYVREWARIVNPKIGEVYPDWITFDAWGQGDRPIIDGHDNIDGSTNYRFISVGSPLLANDNLDENLVGNKFRASNFQTTHDKSNSWYPIEVKGMGDFIEFRRIYMEETIFGEGFIYLSVYTNNPYKDRKIYMESIETLNNVERSIKIEAGGVVFLNGRHRNVGPQSTEHPAPGAANWPNVIVKYIDSEGENIATNNFGLQCRSGMHQYEWCYLKGYGHAMSVFVHASQDGKGGDYEIRNSGYRNIIVEDCKTYASYFGRHEGTTDIADGVWFDRIKLINCFKGLEIAESATNTIVSYSDLSDTDTYGIRVYAAAGVGTKIHNVTAFGNTSQDFYLQRGDVEVSNSNYGILSGTIGTGSNNSNSQLESDLISAGTDLGYYFDLKGNPVANPPSIGPYEFVEVEPITFTVTAIVDPIASGSVSGAGEYEDGEQATLTATPNTGWHFVRWSNDVTDNPYTFTVTGDVTLQAIFSQDEPVPGVIIVKGKFRIV